MPATTKRRWWPGFLLLFFKDRDFEDSKWQKQWNIFLVNTTPLKKKRKDNLSSVRPWTHMSTHTFILTSQWNIVNSLVKYCFIISPEFLIASCFFLNTSFPQKIAYVHMWGHAAHSNLKSLYLLFCFPPIRWNNAPLPNWYSRWL